MTNLCEYVKEGSGILLMSLLTYFFLSSLIQAEWLAAQKDEQAIAGLEDEEEEGVSFSF